MNTCTRTATMIVLAGAAVLAGWAAASPPTAAKPVWLTDLSAARKVARLADKPIFAVLH
jgi:hypothetical protein